MRLVIEKIPAARTAAVNRGVKVPLSRAVGALTFTWTLDVTSAGGTLRPKSFVASCWIQETLEKRYR